MKVERLEISGFKSFVDPVEVRFAGGVTAIVGPNGCGKSNLSEAMTWVLGEQSAKSLRGGTMEDVIFNGSDSRKPLGMAECVLTLRTDAAFPGSDDGRITLGRRVFRGGESQYRLNGKVTRLKEIVTMAESYGLVLTVETRIGCQLRLRTSVGRWSAAGMALVRWRSGNTEGVIEQQPHRQQSGGKATFVLTKL